MSDKTETSVTFYVVIFIALLVLTGLTVAAAFFDMGGLNAAVAVAIASGKAALVILYFMHVRYSQKLVAATVIVGCLWVLILISFTMADFTTRHW